MSNNLLLILLLGENLFLLLAFLVWITRKCSKCQQVKCIERVFARTCWKCYKKSDEPKQQIAI